MITRPLLAQELENLEDIKFPVVVSPKLDGIRCLMVNGKALSRSFKEIPNKYVQKYLQEKSIQGLDGELVTYTEDKLDDYNVIQSKIMSEEGEPNFYYVVFDYVSDNLNKPFAQRFAELVALHKDPKISTLMQWQIDNLEKLKQIEEEWVKSGYEGIMLRNPEGRYKCGRSTLKEGILLKFKRFCDSEAEILDIREKETNIGKKEVNELGLTKRSHKKADRALAGTMGEFWVKDLTTGLEFGIGTGIGLTKELRQELWDNREKYIGKLIKYKYQKAGQKDLPRFPSFLSFRDPRDMS